MEHFPARVGVFWQTDCEDHSRLPVRGHFPSVGVCSAWLATTGVATSHDPRAHFQQPIRRRERCSHISHTWAVVPVTHPWNGYLLLPVDQIWRVHFSASRGAAVGVDKARTLPQGGKNNTAPCSGSKCAPVRSCRAVPRWLNRTLARQSPVNRTKAPTCLSVERNSEGRTCIQWTQIFFPQARREPL